MAGQAACGHQGAGSGTAPASTWGPNERRPSPLHAGPNSRCWQPEQALPKTTVSGASICVKCSFVPPSCGEMSLITSRMVLDTAYLETDGTEGQPRLGWFGGGAVAANCGGDDCWRATPLDCQWLSVDDSSGWVAFWSAPRNAERRAPQSGQSARGRDFRSWPRSIHHMEHAGTALTRQSAGIGHAGRLHLAHWHRGRMPRCAVSARRTCSTDKEAGSEGEICCAVSSVVLFRARRKEKKEKKPEGPQLARAVLAKALLCCVEAVSLGWAQTGVSSEALMLVLPRREVDLGWASQNGELAAIGVLLGWTGGTPEMLVSTTASAARR